jgi:MYXO-CTERM domain-containing protein
VFDAGHRLRISVASTMAPRYYVNPSDGTYFGREGSPRSVAVTLHHDSEHPSFIEVPMPLRDVDEVTVCRNTPPVGETTGSSGASGSGTGGGDTSSGCPCDSTVGPGSTGTGTYPSAGGNTSGVPGEPGQTGECGQRCPDSGALDGSGGCGCLVDPTRAAGAWFALLALAALRRRRAIVELGSEQS